MLVKAICGMGHETEVYVKGSGEAKSVVEKKACSQPVNLGRYSGGWCGSQLHLNEVLPRPVYVVPSAQVTHQF